MEIFKASIDSGRWIWKMCFHNWSKIGGYWYTLSRLFQCRNDDQPYNKIFRYLWVPYLQSKQSVDGFIIQRTNFGGSSGTPFLNGPPFGKWTMFGIQVKIQGNVHTMAQFCWSESDLQLSSTSRVMSCIYLCCWRHSQSRSFNLIGTIHGTIKPLRPCNARRSQLQVPL